MAVFAAACDAGAGAGGTAAGAGAVTTGLAGAIGLAGWDPAPFAPAGTDSAATVAGAGAVTTGPAGAFGLAGWDPAPFAPAGTDSAVTWAGAGAGAGATLVGLADLGFSGEEGDGGCDTDPLAASGLAKRVGMGMGGGAAMPRMVLFRTAASISLPVAGQVRVSGRCCFPQWGQGFASGFTAGSAVKISLYIPWRLVAAVKSCPCLSLGPRDKGWTGFAAGAGAWHSVADVGPTGSRRGSA